MFSPALASAHSTTRCRGGLGGCGGFGGVTGGVVGGPVGGETGGDTGGITGGVVGGVHTPLTTRFGGGHTHKLYAPGTSGGVHTGGVTGGTTGGVPQFRTVGGIAEVPSAHVTVPDTDVPSATTGPGSSVEPLSEGGVNDVVNPVESTIVAVSRVPFTGVVLAQLIGITVAPVFPGAHLIAAVKLCAHEPAANTKNAVNTNEAAAARFINPSLLDNRKQFPAVESPR